MINQRRRSTPLRSTDDSMVSDRWLGFMLPCSLLYRCSPARSSHHHDVSCTKSPRGLSTLSPRGLSTLEPPRWMTSHPLPGHVRLPQLTSGNSGVPLLDRAYSARAGFPPVSGQVRSRRTVRQRTGYSARSVCPANVRPFPCVTRSARRERV